MNLVGVSNETLQSVTDTLYDQFVAGLAQSGYEVVAYDTLKADKQYQSMQARFRTSFDPQGTQLGKSVFVGPHGMPIYTTNDDKHLGLRQAFSGGFTVQPQNIEPQIAKSLDAAVIRATIHVQFAELQTSGGLFHSSSSVMTGVQLALVPELSQYLIVAPNGKRARVVLKQTVLMPTDALSLMPHATAN